MEDHTTQRLRLIVAVGGVLLVMMVMNAAVPSCLGCGGLVFEDATHAPAVNEGVQESLDRQIRLGVLGMSIIAISGFIGQFAWTRRKAGEPIVPVLR